MLRDAAASAAPDVSGVFKAQNTDAGLKTTEENVICQLFYINYNKSFI